MSWDLHGQHAFLFMHASLLYMLPSCEGSYYGSYLKAVLCWDCPPMEVACRELYPPWLGLLASCKNGFWAAQGCVAKFSQLVPWSHNK